MVRMHPTPMHLAAAVLLALLAPSAAAAQIRPDPIASAGARWNPTVAARAGWSVRDASPSLGATLRLPVPLSSLRPALVVGGDVVFQEGVVERQGLVDLTVDVSGGLFAGGGPAVLNTVFESATPRETELGYTLVAGVRGRSDVLSTQVDFRWVRVAGLSPTFLMISLGYPLLGRP